MNSGIYKLHFKDGSYYIGKSVDLTRRKDEHFRSLKLNKHFNENVQFTYLACGFPEFIVLETCSIDKLDNLEQEYLNNSIEDIKNYTCLNINLSSNGGGGYGVNNPMCKNTEEELIQVFKLLLDGIPQKEISKRTNVSINIIKHIANGASHSWLLNIYGNTYTEYLHKSKPLIRITNGVDIIECNEVADISKAINAANSSIYNLLRGVRKQCNGWYLSSNPPKWLKVITDGVKEVIVSEYSNQTSIAKELSLRRTGLNALLHGKTLCYKGWRLRK